MTHLVYGISAWSNPNRPAARHIDDGLGEPLCNSRRHRGGWERDQGEPTCAACLRKYETIKNRGQVCQVCQAPKTSDVCYICRRKEVMASIPQDYGDFI